MRLIWNVIVTLSMVLNVGGQKFQQEQFPFPPHFQTSVPMFSSDSTIYLPPESSTPIPYFAMNNMNKFPIKFLPPTADKAPSAYPTPYPSMISSTSSMDFEEQANNPKDILKRRVSSPQQTPQTNKRANNTDSNVGQHAEKREMRTNPRPNFEQKFEYVEPKKPQYVPGPTSPIHNMPNHNPASRRMIVTSEIQRNENSVDQVKSASFSNTQYIQPPGIFISSTAEPAIPILRLSNEMDLDGSFSYEALGADQTHYVQHSRMENMGTDKEEQVVEGSYSYVGDNGQTYTVHYVADSNGYRASGDHLPVPPAIPEIIQRAIQYNLAEEAKKPPHLRQTWENENGDYDNDETSNRYSVTSIRNLFTGRTPEAFSMGFSQGSNTQNNVPAASSNVPIKSSYEIISDQMKTKPNSPIAPQITFLASQGAHSPSSQLQQSVSRLVSTEKSTLPQLMNYEAGVKDTDSEAAKALWRWQYGLPANDNPNPSKNTISRSSGEGDDIIINFNDMSPEQYTSMIHSQIAGHSSENSQRFLGSPKDFSENDKNQNKYDINSEIMDHNNYNYDNTQPLNNFDDTKNTDKYNNTEIQETILPRENNIAPTTEMISKDITNEEISSLNQNYGDLNKQETNMYSNIISRQNFIPKSNIVTQTYNFEDLASDIMKVDISKENAATEKSIIKNEKIIDSTALPLVNNMWMNDNNEISGSTISPIYITTENNGKFTNYAQETSKSDFKPVTIYNSYYENNIQYSTPESNTEKDDDTIKENIFLKHLFKTKNEEIKKPEKINSIPQTEIHTEKSDFKMEKIPKILQYQPKIQNEIKFNKKKTLDMSDVLNYVALKNHFESAKMKPKARTQVDHHQSFNEKEVRPVRYIPTHENVNENEKAVKPVNNETHRPANNQQLELHGMIKNYKVLQRQRNTAHDGDGHIAPESSYRNIKTFHNLGLPPLGRAGPSLKSYLPPTYV